MTWLARRPKRTAEASAATKRKPRQRGTKPSRPARSINAAKYAKDAKSGAIDQAELDALAKQVLSPFERDPKEGPYAVQHDLQDMMQDLVGIVRTEDEMSKAIEGIAALKVRAEAVGVSSHREYNPGWHTALDLDNLLTVSEAIARAARERKESRGGHFRDDYPDKDPEFAKFNIVLKKAADGSMELRRVTPPPIPDELKQVIEEQK